MHTHQLKHFQAGNLLTECQSGIRPNFSTSTALISAVKLWRANMDAGKLDGGVFIDLKKYFNTVDHNIVRRKLCCYGINGNALQLPESYLADRTQRCYVNAILSVEQHVSCAIPQGYILGPLLFINVQGTHHPERLPMIQITTAHEDISTIECFLNSDLAAEHNWLMTNKLSCNTSKTS